MILEEETYRKFGYYPDELSPKSSKQIVAACDNCDKTRCLKKQDYRALCRSCASKGENNPMFGMSGEKSPNYGKRMSEETKKKIGDANRNPSEDTRFKIGKGNRGKTLSIETRAKMSIAHKGLLTGKNNPMYGKHHTAGENHPMYGKHHTEETCRKISEVVKKYYAENKHPNTGKPISEEQKKKIGDANRGKKSFLGKHHSEETKMKLREARKHQRFPTHHTKPEMIFEEMCKKYDLQFKYTGDGSFWVGNINPDFVECNGRKIAVEIFSYWHDPLRRRNIPYSRTYTGRKELLNQYGWELIVFWQEDLEREDSEKFVLSQLENYPCQRL